MPPEADILSRARVASVTDRGESRGAIVIVEREIRNAEPGTLLCTLRQTLLLRADGGLGGEPPTHVPSRIPDREPDARASFVTEARAALIYRLSGDWNPLHSDPEVGRRAAFDRPILHGLASYGIAGVAVARACGLEPDAVTGLDCRFTGVVFPGDTLTFKIWRELGGAAFQGFVGDRKTLDQGYVAFRSGHSRGAPFARSLEKGHGELSRRLSGRIRGDARAMGARRQASPRGGRRATAS